MGSTILPCPVLVDVPEASPSASPPLRQRWASPLLLVSVEENVLQLELLAYEQFIALIAPFPVFCQCISLVHLNITGYLYFQVTVHTNKFLLARFQAMKPSKQETESKNKRGDLIHGSSSKKVRNEHFFF